MKALRDKLLNVKKIRMFSTQSINPYDGMYIVAEAIKYAKDHYGGDYFTGEKLRQAILEKKTFSSISVPGTIDPEFHTLSKKLAVKKFELKGDKLTEVIAKTYTDKEMAALPEGRLK